MSTKTGRRRQSKIHPSTESNPLSLTASRACGIIVSRSLTRSCASCRLALLFKVTAAYRSVVVAHGRTCDLMPDTGREMRFYLEQWNCAPYRCLPAWLYNDPPALSARWFQWAQSAILPALFYTVRFRSLKLLQDSRVWWSFALLGNFATIAMLSLYFRRIEWSEFTKVNHQVRMW